MALTPNMSLDKPTVSVDAGPGWATRLNADLDLLDAHDHSTGKGAKVTQAGINITGDLSLAGFKLTSIGALRLLSSISPGTLGVYSTGTDLFFTDGSSNSIQVTSSGKVAPCLTGNYGQAGITASLKYTDSTKLYELFQDGGSTYADVKAKVATFTGAAVLQTTLAVTGATTLTGALGAGAATFSGAVIHSSTTALNGDVTIGNGINVVLNTATGTKIGTATNQKLGFYNATPVVQQGAAGANFVNGGGFAVLSGFSSTGGIGATGYQYQDVITALKLYGLLAA